VALQILAALEIETEPLIRRVRAENVEGIAVGLRRYLRRAISWLGAGRGAGGALKEHAGLEALLSQARLPDALGARRVILRAWAKRQIGRRTDAQTQLSADDGGANIAGQRRPQLLRRQQVAIIAR